MFEDYTTEQLVTLRFMCAELVEKTHDLEQRADALLLMEYIEEELALRAEQRKLA